MQCLETVSESFEAYDVGRVTARAQIDRKSVVEEERLVGVRVAVQRVTAEI